jgi:hypothetical protein
MKDAGTVERKEGKWIRSVCESRSHGTPHFSSKTLKSSRFFNLEIPALGLRQKVQRRLVLDC